MRVFVYEYLSGGGAVVPCASRQNGADDGLLEAGRAMRDAVVADLSALPGVSVSHACLDHAVAAPGPIASALYPGPMETAAAFVRRQADAHDVVWVIAPETGGLLAQLAAVVAPAKWIGCTPAALHLASRKRATIARLAAHGLLTPLAFDGEATQWIVKPDDGAGCQRTRLHETHAAAHADLHARRSRGESATLEPCVPGEAMSLSLLCGGAAGLTGERRTELLSINRQRIECSRDGSLSDAGVDIGQFAIDGLHEPRAEALQATAQAVAHAVPGLRGFVGIDVVWHPRRGPVVIEVNPRVTSAYVGLSALLGRKLATEVLAAHAAGLKTARQSGRNEPADATT